MAAFRLISRILNRRTVVALSSPAAQLAGISVLNSLHGFRSFTSQIAPQEGEDGHSFPASYLMSSHGFSPDRAKVSSKFLKFRTTEKPDAVVDLLRSHGFSGTQIARCIKYYPVLLELDPERVLRPKLDFLLSVGISRPELIKVVSSNPYLLIMSLEKCLIPRYNLLKDVLVDDRTIASVLKRNYGGFASRKDSNLVPNIALLRKLGVGENRITYLVSHCPIVLFRPHSNFAEIVELAMHFGFHPSTFNFVAAIKAISSMTKTSWENKLQVYGKWGWAKELTLSAFKMYPNCMCASEEKIMQIMEFLVNELGWESEAAARWPCIFGFSFEKRVVPRCSVVQLLRLRGFIDDIPGFGSFLYCAEDRFKVNFVANYPDDIKAQLLDVYERRVKVVDFRTMAVEEIKARS
ncbi:unnamed protein product [Linum trigynum]|uniref:Uncharacterized protein n=1 Tax=Linum trigynum TaxID=586398 RepID=A0AAV2FZZ4_9ROSI